ncbi:MAG: beta-lactamase family protein, partial [Chloroflexota bacterium]|nr:beta-lactamase family protein [Chloroflexota bacterium]
SGLPWGSDAPAAGQWPFERPAYESLAAATQGEASRWNVPGIAVAVLHHASVESTSAGLTSLTAKRAVTDDTIFQIGSISKVFTATLVMQMVDDGQLDLDTPVMGYVPELLLADIAAREAITLRHLLSHGAGFEGDRFIAYGRGDDALAKSIAAFDTLQQWTAPGELFSYNNAGFSLIGRVIENVTGKTFETAITERLLTPLGLRTAVFFAEEAIGLDHAVGHRIQRREAGHTVAEGYTLPRHVNAAGGIITSTRELLRFARLHIGDGEIDGQRLLSAQSARAMRVPRLDAGPSRGSYGIGWAIRDTEGFRIVSHGGATRGFRAQLTVVPERSFAIAILTNGEPGSRAIQEIESWALREYLGYSAPTPETVKLGKKSLDAFAGTYHRHDGRFTIERANRQLRVTYVSIDEESGEEEEPEVFLLDPIGPRHFRFTEGRNYGAIADFIDLEQAEGTVRHLFRSGGRLAERDEATALAVDPPKAKGSKRDKNAKARS